MFLPLTGLRERKAQKAKTALSEKNRINFSMASQTSWIKSAVETLIVFLPAIIVGIVVLVNSVNIPVWDDWERGVMLQKYYENSPDFLAYMAGAHIDHRMIVPRVLMLVMNDVTSGNIWWEIVLSFTIYLAGAYCLFRVLKSTMGETRWMYFTALMFNIALFSPVQYQNFMWAVQLAMLLPFACLGFMLFSFRHETWPVWKKFVVVFLSALVGTLSFGHGMVLWPVAFMLPLLSKSLGTLKVRLSFASGILIAAVTTLSLYFLWNFENVSVHAYGQMPGETPPGVKNFAAAPGEIFRFMLTTIGNPTARFFSDVIAFSPKMGRATLAILIISLGMIFYTLRKHRDRDSLDRLLPWMAMAGYGVVVTFAMALGRSSHGWEKGVHSRYAGPGVFICAALVVLVAWLLLQWREKAKSPEIREFRTRCAIVIAMLWVAFQVPTWLHSFDKIAQWKATRLQQKASLVYIKHFDPEVHRRHDYSLEFFVKQALYLDSKGLLNPPLIEEKGFGHFTPTDTILEYKRADLIVAGITAQGMYLKGFATVKGPDRMADGVLVTYRESGSDQWHIVEMAEMRPLLHNTNNAVDGVFSGSTHLGLPHNSAQWREMVPIDELPADKDIEVVFWAMDAEKMRLQRFKESLKFNLAETPVGTILFEENEVKARRKAAKELAVAD